MNYFANKKILVPFDFSDPSREAVNTAIEISVACNNITVLHVIEPMPAYGIGARYNDEIDEQHSDKANRSLKAVFDDPGYEGITFHTMVGDPPQAIADFAAENRISLIVMPSHGRTGLKRLFTGSVAERVVRLAHCPVLVLRH